MTATHIFVIEKTKECNRYKNINQSQIGYLDDGTIGNICRFQRFFPIKKSSKTRDEKQQNQENRHHRQ